MREILQSLRTLLIDHLVATQPLTMNVPAGTNTVIVPNTSRFRPNDQIYFLSNSSGFGETAIIESIPDYQTLVLANTVVRTWTVLENAYVQKAVNDQFIKGIYIGDMKIIPSFPAITLTQTGESNEWYTLRSTSHEYKIAIRTYVLADNFETSEFYLASLSEQIREILIDHIRPIINGQSHPLTVDLPAGGAVVTVADTTDFATDLASPAHTSIAFLRDAQPRPSQQETQIKTVLSSTQLELTNPAVFDYLVGRQAEIIRVNRLLYDSRPSDISYGYVRGSGSSFLRASEITWFGKEMLCREGNFLT